MSSTYWRTAEGVPVVHIFGTSSKEGSEEARAGYGVDWGPNDAKNAGGSPIGRKTELRAELTAMDVVLATAIEHRIKSIVIRHKSRNLSLELQKWEFEYEDHTFENKDLLRAIGRQRMYVAADIIEVAPYHQTGFEGAQLQAKRVAGKHSSAAVPLTDENWETGTRIVDIFGACNDGSGSPTAGFSVYWGAGDIRNQSGHPPGLQTSYRAYLCALNSALSTARFSGHDEIIIRSRNPSIHQLINGSRNNNGWMRSFPTGSRNRDLIEAINENITKFRNIIHLLPPKERFVEGQKEAERLARQHSGMRNNHVTIYGLPSSSSNGIARWGLFWGEEHQDNESGQKLGKHEEFCAEMHAFRRALQVANSRSSHHLTVYTDSKALREFVTNWRNKWKLQHWVKPSDGHLECVEMCKEVDSLLDVIVSLKISKIHSIPLFPAVKLSPGCSGNLEDARKLATPTTVRTVGVFDGEMAKYGVFWKDSEIRNESGRVTKQPSELRAKLIGIRRALEIAIEEKIQNLRIITDYQLREGRDEILMTQIKVLKMYIGSVKFKRAPLVKYQDSIIDTF